MKAIGDSPIGRLRAKLDVAEDRGGLLAVELDVDETTDPDDGPSASGVDR
jgi:hypothetical protein